LIGEGGDPLVGEAMGGLGPNAVEAVNVVAEDDRLASESCECVKTRRTSGMTPLCINIRGIFMYGEAGLEKLSLVEGGFVVAVAEGHERAELVERVAEAGRSFGLPALDAEFCDEVLGSVQEITSWRVDGWTGYGAGSIYASVGILSEAEACEKSRQKEFVSRLAEHMGGRVIFEKACRIGWWNSMEVGLALSVERARLERVAMDQSLAAATESAQPRRL
jgi:hypothetical protein